MLKKAHRKGGGVKSFLKLVSGFLSSAVLLLAAVCLPLLAQADTYPAQNLRAVYNSALNTARSTDAAACAAFISDLSSTGSWCQVGPGECGTTWQVGVVCGQPYPFTSGFCDIPAGNLGAGRRVTCPVVLCPNGGSLSGDQCINAPPCSTGQARDPVTGACGLTKKNKALGPPCQIAGAAPLSIGNPCNAGTGTKYHAENIYSGGAKTLLVERLSYNSRLLADTVAVAHSPMGSGWTGYYHRQLLVLSTGVVVLRRHTGQWLDFVPPASGNVYVADADVADRLERLTDLGGNTIGWKYTVAADDSTELYSSTGRLLSIADRAGSTTTLTYSDGSTPASVAPQAGYLIVATDQWGRSLSYIYNAQGALTRITDPAGGTYDFTHDANGNLTSITFPDTRVRQFLYNEAAHTGGTALPHSLTGIIDENGVRFATYKYDSEGRVVSTEHAGGANKSTLAYTSAFAITTVTDALNVSRSYGLAISHWVPRGTGVTGAACPACGAAAQTHDANGNVSSRTDWNGNRTNYSFDLTRNLETARTEGLTSAGATTPQTRTISTQWHATFQLPTGIAEPLQHRNLHLRRRRHRLRCARRAVLEDHTSDHGRERLAGVQRHLQRLAAHLGLYV